MSTNSENNQLQLKLQIAQKIMLDFRFYNASSSTADRTAVTQLPDELKHLISQTGIGGVILFSDNLTTAEQIISLNQDLQQAAAKSTLKLPLFISVDQEGGRVFRTDRQLTTAFTGNMAIGATYENKSSEYSVKVGEILANELKVLGFNVNHAPTVDVNVNPDNPVINVRAFGEQPDMVAKLGLAQSQAMQSQGILSTLKHFPGHGDTDVDSHTGLPRVNHNIETIYQMDIAPFKHIIAHSDPAMIMTAHIQYPALDDSQFTAKDGRTMIKPATMSRTIMTDILRQQLNYDGVVITDALDMAGIADFFTPTDAVINTFKAGVDIALMPIKIRTADDLSKLPQLIDDIAHAVNQGLLCHAEITESFERIKLLKQRFKLQTSFNQSKTALLSQAKAVLACNEHRQVEQQLSDDAITLIKHEQSVLPIKANSKLHLIMPDTIKGKTLAKQLEQLMPLSQPITITNMQQFNLQQAKQQIEQADIVIGAHISPKQSAAEMGGMDDLTQNQTFSEQISGPEPIYQLLKHAKQQGKQTIFISLRTPYEIKQFNQVADVTLASYAYSCHFNQDENQYASPALLSLAKVLVGEIKAKGKLPVSL